MKHAIARAMVHACRGSLMSRGMHMGQGIVCAIDHIMALTEVAEQERRRPPHAFRGGATST